MRGVSMRRFYIDTDASARSERQKSWREDSDLRPPASKADRQVSFYELRWSFDQEISCARGGAGLV